MNIADDIKTFILNEEILEAHEFCEVPQTRSHMVGNCCCRHFVRTNHVSQNGAGPSDCSCHFEALARLGVQPIRSLRKLAKTMSYI